MQLTQPLLEAGIARSYAFVREYGALLEDTLCVLYAAWFSYETQFHFDGYKAHGNSRTTMKAKDFDSKHVLICRI
jgi:hypothetical protein